MDQTIISGGVLLISYLLGSIPFGLVLTRLAGHEDIRKHGSGNIGATNVLRNTSKGLAFATLILDGGKGAAAIFIAFNFAPQVTALAGLAAFLGHLYTVIALKDAIFSFSLRRWRCR